MELGRGLNGPENIRADKRSMSLEAQEQQGKKKEKWEGESQASELSAPQPSGEVVSRKNWAAIDAQDHWGRTGEG